MVSVISLFDDLADGVYTLAYRLLRDRHLAEDAVQETFLAILRGRAPYRGDGPLAAWVYRIGYRQTIAIARRRRDVATEAEQLARLDDRTSPPADAAALERELAGRLDIAINALNPTLRAAFVLRDIEELPTREVAEILEISESAVKMRLTRARADLRDQLKGYLSEAHV
jgi:RNA polymerase sigma-70 factor (ECF subfamily)